MHLSVLPTSCLEHCYHYSCSSWTYLTFSKMMCIAMKQIIIWSNRTWTFLHGTKLQENNQFETNIHLCLERAQHNSAESILWLRMVWCCTCYQGILLTCIKQPKSGLYHYDSSTILPLHTKWSIVGRHWVLMIITAHMGYAWLCCSVLDWYRITHQCYPHPPQLFYWCLAIMKSPQCCWSELV